MDYRPNWLRSGLLVASLLPLCGCATDRTIAAPPLSRPAIPAELNQDPPPPGAFRACLTELLQGQTSGPACSILPTPAK